MSDMEGILESAKIVIRGGPVVFHERDRHLRIITKSGRRGQKEE